MSGLVVLSLLTSSCVVPAFSISAVVGDPLQNPPSFLSSNNSRYIPGRVSITRDFQYGQGCDIWSFCDAPAIVKTIWIMLLSNGEPISACETFTFISLQADA